MKRLFSAEPEGYLEMVDFSCEPVGPNADIASISINGDLESINCEYLLQCVDEQIENGFTKLILNCDRLVYISSMGLGMMVRVNSRIKKLGGDVKLACLHGRPDKILRLVKLDKVFQIYPSVEEAAASFD